MFRNEGGHTGRLHYFSHLKAVAPTSLSTTLLPNIGLTIIPHLVSATIAVPSVYTTGLYTPQSGTMVSLSLFQTTYMQAFDVYQRAYELHDHLGNVRMVTSDQVWYNGMYNNVNPGGFYTYYAFGSLMPAPYWDRLSDNGYKFGFNGQERDDYISGSGNSMAFNFREYDSRAGRWSAVDPLFKKYPSLSPYAFAGNNPIANIDPDGRDIVYFNNAGREVNRVITDQKFETFVGAIGNWHQAPMPKL